jgi:hypothetical protein
MFAALSGSVSIHNVITARTDSHAYDHAFHEQDIEQPAGGRSLGPA